MRPPHEQTDPILAELDRRYEERLAERDRLYNERDRRYEERFHAQDRAVMAALASAERAVLKAEAAAERRFESINEFRGTLADQQRNLMPRSEVALAIEAVHEKINGIAEKINPVQRQLDALRAERDGVKGGWLLAVGAVGIVLTILALMLAAARLMSVSSVI